MSTRARSKACSLNGTSRGSMSATSGRSSVMPVSTSTRASGWSMTWTQTGHRSPSTSNSATSRAVIVGGGAVLLPEVRDEFPVVLDMWADDQNLETFLAGFERARNARADPYRVEWLEWDELVVELHPARSRDDDVDLFGGAMTMSEGLA